MKKLITLSLIFSLFLVSCDKLPNNNNNQSFNASNPAPTFNNADGLMAAITTLSYQSTPIGDIAVEADVATAAFFNTSTTFFNAGTVGVNTNDLEINDNNSYASVSSTTANIDLDFSTSSGNTWVVGGSSDVAAFNHTTSRGMPSDIKFTAEVEDVNTANSFTISIESAPSTCDSILYLLAAENKTVTKTVSSNTSSVTFTSSEMSGLDGAGVAQVAAYNFEFSEENGKIIYYVNEKVISDLVNFE